MTFKSIVEHIKSLPPLSDVALSVQKLYAENADVDTIKLVKLVESDALLTANILRLMNTPYYSFSHKISSIKQAVTLLGSRTMHTLIIHYAMRESLKTKTGIYGLTSESFNDMCNLQKALITQWYAKVDLRDAQFLSPLALMMETGKLILERELVASDYLEEYLKDLYTCESIQEYEKELFDMSSYQITGLLLEHWNLDPIYVEVLKGMDSTKEEREENDAKIQAYIDALNVVRTAINVNAMLTEDSISKAAKLVQQSGLNPNQFIATANLVKESYLDDI